MEQKYKDIIISVIENFITSLNDINNLSLENVYDDQLIKSFESIRNVIFKGISNIRKTIEILSKSTEWEKLNISFFGETNAGKSTIIESLINGDGSSIGEGYKDFTKTVSKISYKNINLMDMPGIEGREYNLIKNIHKAVNKSHVVFYIVGTNKEPEAQTISKIKKFLKDNVKVYSVINVRGKPTVYKYKSEIKDKNTLIVESRIKDKFDKLLEGNYSGNVIVNGYVALLKSNRLKNTRFENDQEKALKIFGNKIGIEKFSNIMGINKIIDCLSSEIQDEIKISNTYKFLNSLGYILAKILHEKKNFDSFIKKTNNLTSKYLEDVDNIIKKYETEINRSLDININRLRVDLKNAINNSIDCGDEESSVKSKLNRIKQNNSKALNKNIKDLLFSMKSEIEGKIIEFKNRMSLQMSIIDLKGEFSLENILEALKLNFKYVLGQIIDVGLSIWGIVLAFAINPILGIVAGVFALARKIWDWFFGDPDKRKRAAKKEAISKINSLINDIEKNVKQDLESELLKVNKNTKKPVIQLVESMRGIKNISLSIDEKISDIKKSQKNLSVLLIKEILGDNTIFSYIDLNLSEIVIIGYSLSIEEKRHLSEKLRINNLNIYKSYNEWLREVGKNDCIDTFTAKDEFNYRAVNALMLHDCSSINFNKVKRSS